MKIFHLLSRVRQAVSNTDRRIVSFVQSHANLTTALLTVGLSLWALTSNHAPMVLRMAVMGAIGYFLGISPAITAGILSLGWRLYISVQHGFSLSTLLLEAIGYACSAWLGYQHKAQKERQERAADPHAPQVLPWAVVNEIRTSLAAIRFLLFPLHDEQSNQALQQATQELSRLEELFHQMEQRDRAEQHSNEASRTRR